jgi:transcription factor MYC2
MMEAQFLWEADSAMIEAFMGPEPGLLPSSAPPGYEGQGQQDDPTGTMGESGELSDTVLLQKLHSLVEDTHVNWTYGIFWQLSRSPTEEL